MGTKIEVNFDDSFVLKRIKYTTLVGWIAHYIQLNDFELPTIFAPFNSTWKCNSRRFCPSDIFWSLVSIFNRMKTRSGLRLCASHVHERTNREPQQNGNNNNGSNNKNNAKCLACWVLILRNQFTASKIRASFRRWACDISCCCCCGRWCCCYWPGSQRKEEIHTINFIAHWSSNKVCRGWSWSVCKLDLRLSLQKARCIECVM